MLKDISKLLSQYFAAIPKHVAKDPQVMTFDKGYYYSTSKELNTYEDQFISYTKTNLDSLLDILKTSKDTADIITAIHLIGWHQKPKETYQIIKPDILNPKKEIRNAAARTNQSFLTYHQKLS